MTNDFQIVFHNIEQSTSISDAVNKRISKLQRFCDRILAGRVVLDSPHNNHHKGKVYSVGLEIHTPSKEVRVNQEQHDNHAHEDLYVAIRDAFNAAERQLKAIHKKHRTERNHHSSELEAVGI
ncbi:MAG: ribosome-associated translation inhibitor RaiA [Pseudomonadota bacterium]|nr:ribosome-associated translation inhibitor RaiA [Pseudomonadota bacterium]